MNDETKHSPEPWGIWTSPAPQPYCAYVCDAEGVCIARTTGMTQEEANASARRIVACVNACAGLPVEALEAGELGKALDLAEDAALEADSPALSRALRALGRLP
jgi:hypothetical protein